MMFLGFCAKAMCICHQRSGGMLHFHANGAQQVTTVEVCGTCFGTYEKTCTALGHEKMIIDGIVQELGQ